MKDNQEIAKDYTEWLVKTGGCARDMTLRDHFAGLAMQKLISADQQTPHDYVTVDAYSYADAMLKERAK
jgi:hypothetical protein